MNLMEIFDMQILQTDKENVVIEMPITDKVKQPMGYLHGGASVELAETAASIGGLQHIDQTKQAVVGLEINCNHIKAKKDGKLIANAQPFHVGRKTMVWEIKLTDEAGELVAAARCTLAVVTTS
ncbi:hotdog fold thioesterase [Gracilibacillus oryzae]|nr:hotdog fold thioesterase [Gracilibacillus oryzae]